MTQFITSNLEKHNLIQQTALLPTKGSFSWWFYKRGSLGLEAARPMGAQLLKNAAAWLGLC
jgi:hypothetical protein